MIHFYDGQIRRYLIQTIRVFSNFSVKYADGTLVQIPVVYGDPDRQAAAILRQNSENKVNSVPRIAVYITGLEMDRERLSDASFVGKVHVRERNIDEETGVYGTNSGASYTVERLMPTPFKLKMKVDIWSANTDQKLQIMEQILVLFNPTLELQTTDNYVDWTSLSLLEITDLTWSSRTIPVGNDSPIDLATLTVAAPIWINPPVKVKQMGIITAIVTSINNGSDTSDNNYIDGLGVDPSLQDTTSMSDLLTTVHASVAGYGVQVYGGRARLLDKHEGVIATSNLIGISEKIGPAVNWRNILDQYPGQYKAGYSKIYLKQTNDLEVSGTFALDPMDETVAIVNWDQDTYPTNTNLDPTGPRASAPWNSTGTFDAIIDPTTKGPNGSGLADPIAGTRYLIIESIYGPRTYDAEQDNDYEGGVQAPGVKAWGNLTAYENDIIQWSGTEWQVIFSAAAHQNITTPVYQTNIYTGVQYKWDGIAWTKSFEGEYREGGWRLRL